MPTSAAWLNAMAATPTGPQQINGRSVVTASGDQVLETANLLDPNWRTRLLSVITNPNMAVDLTLVFMASVCEGGDKPEVSRNPP